MSIQRPIVTVHPPVPADHVHVWHHDHTDRPGNSVCACGAQQESRESEEPETTTTEHTCHYANGCAACHYVAGAQRMIEHAQNRGEQETPEAPTTSETTLTYRGGGTPTCTPETCEYDCWQ